MVETLTESFCERCGTRYEFSAPTRLNPLRKTRGFFGGLKNYLTSQDALSDAMGDAMRSEEDQLAAAQLEAFHESFNFCIECRQYTCLNCWNDPEGRCRTCAPIAGTDDLADRLAASYHGTPTDVVEPTLTDAALQRRLGADAWPSADAVVTPHAAMANGHTAWPTADAEAALEPAAFVDDTRSESASTWDTEPTIAEPAAPDTAGPEPVVAEVAHEPEPEPVVAEVAPEPEPEPVVSAVDPDASTDVAAETEPSPTTAGSDDLEPSWEAGPFAAAAEGAPTEASWPAEPLVAESEPDAEPMVAAGEADDAAPRVLRVVAWEEDAAYEVAEPVVAEAVPEPEPEPVVAEAVPEPEPEPVVAEVAPEPEPEPVVAEVAPEPEPEPLPAPKIAPISETILRFPARTQPAASEPTDAERVAAQDDSPELAARRAQLDLLGLGDPGQGPVAPERPAVLPYRSRGATVSSAELTARATNGGFWEASAREVAGAAANIGVQNCGQCGLSLSANARFCRRCGTRQARSA